MDFSGIRKFYDVIDNLKTDQIPSEEYWNSFFSKGYYGFYHNWNQDQLIKKFLSIAFQPSRFKDYDSLIRLNNYYSNILKHLRSADSLKENVFAYQDSIASTNIIEDAKKAAIQWLPKDARDSIQIAPVVNFGIFQPDGNADKEVAIDILYAMNTDLKAFLSHEFHHFYVSLINKKFVFNESDSSSVLLNVVRQLQLEGIADFIDKGKAIQNNGKGMSAFAWPIYSQHYFNPEQNFKKVDSLLAYTFEHPESYSENSKLVKNLFPLGGHPHGHFMAKAILDRRGKDSVLATLDNPFKFIRDYNAVALDNPEYYHFSEATMHLLEELELHYTNSRNNY